jgi:hypothetical protein
LGAFVRPMKIPSPVVGPCRVGGKDEAQRYPLTQLSQVGRRKASMLAPRE